LEYGIHQDGTYRDLTVKNGNLNHWCDGVFAEGDGAILSHLQASTNYEYAIFATGTSVISDCITCNNWAYGIRGQVISRCVANYNGETGINGNTISDCTANHNRNGIEGMSVSNCTADENRGTGITAMTVFNCSVVNNGGVGIFGRTVSDCTASYNPSIGISLQHNGKVSGCSCYGNDIGIMANSDSLVIENTCFENGGSSAGILVTGHGCRIEGNNCTDNGYGIKVDDNGNFIVKNTAHGNTTNYLIHAGSHFRISTSLTGADAWDNFEF
jgi:parallel beta-helix repeat protein